MLIHLRIIIFHLCLIPETQMQLNGDIRLRDGTLERKGRLEVFYSSQWGTVCDDQFDDKDAIVACKQLGYSTGFMVINTLIPDGTGPIWLDDIVCSGTENRLDSCVHGGWGVHNCGHSEDVGVECFTSLGTGTLRIIEDTLPMQGRLEVYYNGYWGTICDDNFEDVDALVACRQIGYSTGVTLGNTVTDGSGTILLDEVACTGTEFTIASCGNRGWNVSDCTHIEDVGVHCFIKNRVDGSWGSWSSWSGCSLLCGGGIQYRSRECNNPTPINGGNCCEGISYSSQVCNSNACAVNGNWGTWSSLSTCSTSCGGGIANRTRSCNNPVPSNGGFNCTEHSADTIPCNTDPCPVNGGWSIWSAWGLCNTTCGGGIQQRTRLCDNPPPFFGGNSCSGLNATLQVCNTGNCPVNGNWGEWSVWNSCSLTCGNGTMSRYRSCNSPAPSFGGLNCSGVSLDSTSCKTDSCPVNGAWSAWSIWTTCIVTCGGGIQQRSRDCNNPTPVYGGNCCSGSMIQSQICNSNSCPVDGGWSIWSVWGSCNVTCGGGIQQRTRVCDTPPPSFGGISCNGANTTEQICNPDHCPVNGNWGEWSIWNVCSLSCGNGTTSRYRSCNNPAPSFGGINCSDESLDSTYCKTDPCPVNGNWEQWSNWSNCSENCGFEIQNRTRDCSNPSPSNGGMFCQGLPLEIQICSSLNCPDAERTFEAAGHHSDTALAGVAVGCVVTTAVIIFIIQFMIRCIYKSRKEISEYNNRPEESYEDLEKKRICRTPDNESFDRLKNASSGTYDNLTENAYENLQLESIEARASNIYQNS